MDDLEFVQRCIRQEKDAWGDFVEQYSRLIYKYIHGVLNTKGVAAAARGCCADICQEILHSLINDNFRRLKTFRARNGCSLASWLRQVTVNFTIDYLRRAGPALLPVQQEPKDDSISAAEALAGSERIEVLRECIEGLGGDDKYFLELHLNRGLSLENLKAHFKLSRSAIDMRKLRLVGRLRDCFKAKGFEIP